MNETPATALHKEQHSGPSPPETAWRRSWWSTITWEWALLGVLTVAALAVVAVVTVLLFMGLLEMIAVVSPVVVAVLIVWVAYLSHRTIQLEKTVKALRQERR